MAVVSAWPRRQNRHGTGEDEGGGDVRCSIARQLRDHDACGGWAREATT